MFGFPSALVSFVGRFRLFGLNGALEGDPGGDPIHTHKYIHTHTHIRGTHISYSV